MIRMIVSDMDGTLFYGHGPSLFDLTERNEQALQRCRQAGIGFSVASGRTALYGETVLRKYGLPHPIVGGFNGAVCVDNGVTQYALTCDCARMREVVCQLSTVEPVLCVQAQDLDSCRIFLDPSHSEAQRYRKECRQTGLGSVAEKPLLDVLDQQPELQIGKLSVLFADTRSCRQWQQRLQAQLAESYYVVNTGRGDLLEIGRRDGNKGTFIRYLSETYGYTPQQIAVIGDAENDLQMFAGSAHRFVMAHADPQVKRREDHVVDGVATCIDWCLDYNRQHHAG